MLTETGERPNPSTTPDGSAQPPAGVTIFELGARSCRWPLWADDVRPVAGTSLYCGARTVAQGASYCACHAPRPSGGARSVKDLMRLAGAVTRGESVRVVQSRVASGGSRETELVNDRVRQPNASLAPTLKAEDPRRFQDAADLRAHYDAVRARLRQGADSAAPAPEPEPVPPDEPCDWMAEIIGAVCAHYDVTATQIRAAGRVPHVALARQVAMYLADNLTLNSLAAIGAALGGRDATTIQHGARKIEARMAGDAAFAADVQALRLQLIGGGA